MKHEIKAYLVSFPTSSTYNIFDGNETIYTDYLVYATSKTNLFKKCKEKGYTKSQVLLKTIE